MQPPSSETPLIGTYFSCIMIMVGCHVHLCKGHRFLYKLSSSIQVASSVVCTIMILNYHHRLANTHSMPKWISIIFLQVIKTSPK